MKSKVHRKRGKQRKLWKVLFLSVMLSALVIRGVAAESRTVGDTTGSTYHVEAEDKYKAFTFSSSQKYWLWVAERAWGASPNPLKDERIDYKYWANMTNIVGIWDGYYGIYVTQHESQVYPYANSTFIYTSGTGCWSSFCWWYYGIQGGCPGTC